MRIGFLIRERADDSNIIEIPTEMCVDTKEERVDSVFDDFKRNIGNAEYFQSRVIVLAAKNEILNQVNDSMVDAFLETFMNLQALILLGILTAQPCFLQRFSTH